MNVLFGFPMFTSSGTENTVLVEKDSNNLSSGFGDGSTVTYYTSPVKLSVRVYDFDRGTYNLTVPTATINFRLRNESYSGGSKLIGSNLSFRRMK